MCLERSGIWAEIRKLDAAKNRKTLLIEKKYNTQENTIYEKILLFILKKDILNQYSQLLLHLLRDTDWSS